MLCVITPLQEVSAVQKHNISESRMPIDRCVNSVGLQSVEAVMNMCEHIAFAWGVSNTKLNTNYIKIISVLLL